MKKTLLFTALFLLCIGSISAQRGKDFWFAVPQITTGDGAADGKARFVFTSYDQVTTIHITQVQVPGFTPINITHTLQPNTSWEWNAGGATGPGLGVLEVLSGFPQPYALHMTADADFSCYFANVTRNSEVYTLKGANALGTNFIVPMQYEYASGYYARGYNSIEILATEDSTKIEVELFKLTDDPRQTTAHQTVVIYLNKGFAYSFHSLSDNSCPGADHLYNTRIKSNKPIAVNSTDDSVKPGDLVGDQIVPISLCGKSYVAINNSGTLEKVYIFPTENNTVVTIGGVQYTMNLPVTNLTANNSQMVYTLTSPATYISANKPIMVWQIATEGEEIGGGMLPKLECTGSMETSYRRAGGGKFTFNIVTRTDQTDAFTVNGVAGIIVPSDFLPVPSLPGYSYCIKNMVPHSTANGIRLKNTKGYFHVAAFDTPGASCTYGYFSDYHPIRLNVVSSQPNYTPGDAIRLWMTNAAAFTNITWTKPDGTVVVSDEINIPNPTATDAGFYTVTATSKDGCQIEEDGVVVVNFAVPETEHPSVCAGNSIDLTAKGYATYKWTPASLPQNQATVSVSPTTTTTYKVQNYKIGQNIIYNGDFQKDNTFFTSDYIYGGTVATAVATIGNYSVWRNAKDVNAAFNRVYDHTTGDGTNGRFLIANCSDQARQRIWTRKVEVIPNARYEFAAWFLAAAKGAAPAKLRLAINGQPIGTTIQPTDPGTVPKQTDWKQFTFPYQNDVSTTIELSIETDEGNPNGVGVCIDDITFKPLFAITDTFIVNVLPQPSTTISGDAEMCRGVAVLDGGTDIGGIDFVTYRWYNINNNVTLGTDRMFNVPAAGTYEVEVGNGSCTNTASFTVLPGESMTIALNETDFEFCGNTTGFAIPYTVLDGVPQTYSLLFDASALAAGFTNVNSNALAPAEVQVPLPSSIQAGFYNATLKIENPTGCVEDFTTPISITVKIDPNSLMEQKWNDVIALYNAANNGGYAFQAFQWYKNGSPLAGETGSYIYLANDVLRSTDRYCVLLTLADGMGTQWMTCDFIPDDRGEDITLPTLANIGQVIFVQNVQQTYNVRLMDINGRTWSTQTLSSEQPTLTVPNRQGMYILRLQAADTDAVRTYRMIVQ